MLKLIGCFLAVFMLLIVVQGCEQVSSMTRNHAVNHKAKHKKPEPVIRLDTPNDTICIAAVGDIMLGSSYPDSSKLPPDSAKSSFKAASGYFAGADVVFGNLEGTLLDSGMPSAYKKKLETAYLFRMPT